ncbi:MAG: FMN-binding glutamate synthase family protein [Gammaproteobacteria bacterium]|jgi:glutamate synthase domain-containing protein 2
MTLALQIISLLAYLFALVAGVGLLAIAIMYVIDVTQTKHAIRRNFPVIGRFRYFFEHLGEFFRQYFFALDREELPFNRAERAWAYRASKGVDNTVPFGSTRDTRKPGTVIFVNHPWPVLDRDAAQTRPKTVGPFCRQPYTTNRFFHISAMSYGALSKPAIQALSRGAKKAGIWLNTGEGGLAAYHLEGGADIVFQIGTAKYGCRDEQGRLSDAKLQELAALDVIKMFELKLSQGAKPGKGGMLPGAKVTAEIARIRGIPEGQDSISPNRHPECDSVPELLELIAHIREVTGKPVGFKAAISHFGWIDEMCAEIHRRGIEAAPDFITIDSGDGGTGAAPMPLIDNVGLLLRESLPNVVDRLEAAGLDERIQVVASGKMTSPAEAAWAFCAGADFIVSARGFMFALGCIQAMQCNRNTCPTGITTHDRDLQRGLDPADKSERVFHFARNMEKEVNMIAHACGVGEPRMLTREHCRIADETGRTRLFSEIFPPVRKARSETLENHLN